MTAISGRGYLFMFSSKEVCFGWSKSWSAEVSEASILWPIVFRSSRPSYFKSAKLSLGEVVKFRSHPHLPLRLHSNFACWNTMLQNSHNHVLPHCQGAVNILSPLDCLKNWNFHEVNTNFVPINIPEVMNNFGYFFVLFGGARCILMYAVTMQWSDTGSLISMSARVHKNKSMQRLISSLWGPGTAKFQVTWLLRIVQNGVSVW